ncbi:MAG TPA: alpha-xylosidase, partial [Pseudonocardiaceae bacterium]|nr:alpha-xylosidase [Pseudonocardiaceae bacterium]
MSHLPLFRTRRRSGALVLAVAAAVAGPSAATATAAPAASNVIVDGHARFEVLTPTLIRLEYAGDDRFQDGATFNVPARNLPVPAFTTDVAGGFREIHTAGLTLRYQENSGPFTRANTSVQLTGTSVTATPEFPSYCVFNTPCQAENGLLGGS